MRIVDDLKREILIDFPPKRIVSLVPSLTELLFDLGLEENIVGVTKFCCHPKVKCQSKVYIGGTKTVKIDKLAELKPDLIIANKEENDRENMERFMDRFPTYISDIITIDDALNNIRKIGEMVNAKAASQNLIEEINHGFKTIKNIASGTVAYFIWQEPNMLAGSGTYIHELLQYLGFVNVVKSHPRYPIQDGNSINELKPDYIFLSSEPFPFKEKHLAHYQSIFPGSQVILVDGEMFSWYGSRMKLAVDYFQQLVNGLNS